MVLFLVWISFLGHFDTFPRWVEKMVHFSILTSPPIYKVTDEGTIVVGSGSDLAEKIANVLDKKLAIT